jgi:type II secretory pathway pseudopilin PulG
MNTRPTPSSTFTTGFTLVEVLVSLALFMVVITISVGSMMVLIDANAKMRTIQSLMNSVSFTLDSMTREIRQGSAYTCANNLNQLELDGMAPGTSQPDGESPVNNGNGNDNGQSNKQIARNCSTPRSAFAFTETDSSLTDSCAGRRIGYRLGTHDNENGRVEQNICNTGWVPVTPSEVNIHRLDFFVANAESIDNESPIVTIVIEGEAGEYPELDSSFAIQTTVTQRALDL